MVQHSAIERLRRGCQPAGGPAVGVAWPRVAARVVVRQNDASAAMLGRVDDDLPKRKLDAGLVTWVTRHVQAPRLVVDVRDPQAFAARVRIGQASCEEFSCGGETVEPGW